MPIWVCFMCLAPFPPFSLLLLCWNTNNALQLVFFGILSLQPQGTPIWACFWASKGGNAPGSNPEHQNACSRCVLITQNAHFDVQLPSLLHSLQFLLCPPLSSSL